MLVIYKDSPSITMQGGVGVGGWSKVTAMILFLSKFMHVWQCCLLLLIYYRTGSCLWEEVSFRLMDWFWDFSWSHTPPEVHSQDLHVNMTDTLNITFLFALHGRFWDPSLTIKCFCQSDDRLMKCIFFICFVLLLFNGASWLGNLKAILLTLFTVRCDWGIVSEWFLSLLSVGFVIKYARLCKV